MDDYLAKLQVQIDSRPIVDLANALDKVPPTAKTVEVSVKSLEDVLKRLADAAQNAANENNKLGQAAEQTASRWQTMSRAVSQTIGNLASDAIKKGIEWIKEYAEGLIALDKAAQHLQEPMSRIFQLGAAAKPFKIDAGDLAKGLEGLGAEMDKARYGASDLEKWLKANGQTLLDNKGHLIGTQDALAKVADLVQNAHSYYEKLDILQAAGLPKTEEWVKFLEQGGASLRQSVDTHSELAEKQQTLIEQSKEFERVWKGVLDNLKEYFLSQFDDIRRYLADFINSTVTDIKNIFTGLRAVRLTDRTGTEEGSIGGLLAKLADTVNPAMRVQVRGEGTSTRDPTRGLTNRPPTDGGKTPAEKIDEFDRMTKRIEDQTRRLEEQAATFGKTAGEVARYRAEQELLTAAQRAGKEITPELQAQIDKLADKYAKAADELERLHKQQELINGLTSAGTTAFTSIFKDLASGTSAADSFTKALGGIGDALTNIGKKSLDQSLTKGIEGLLKGGGLGSFSFDPISLGLGAVGLGISLFTGQQEQQKAKRQKQLDDAKTQAEEAARKAQEINQAISTYLQRITAAAFAGQADTLENRLAQFDAKAQSERLDALSKGGAAINLLEQALGMERNNIINDWNKRIVDDQVKSAEDAQAKIDAILQRQQSAQDRIFAAGIDTTTLTGRMAALERQFARERFEEMKAGGEAMTDLLAAQDAERLRLLKDSSDEWLRTQKAAFDDAKSFLEGALKSIKQYLDSLTSGSQSPLSPAGRLAAARSQFATQLGLAQGGNRDALSGITGYADSLLQASRAMNASSAAFQADFAQVQGSLGALPSQVSPEQFIVNAINKQTDDLSQVFDSIDVNNDGVISRQEATNTFLASIFDELDTNGDGMLQKSELIRLNTGNTATSTGNTDGYTQSLTTYSASINALTNTMVGIQSTMSSQLSTQIQQLTTAVINLTLMTKVVWNTAQLVTYTTNGFGSPQYAVGGYIDGPGSGTSDSVRARVSRGEFITRASSVARIGLPAMNYMNDNGVLPASNSADYAALREEVRLLRQQLAVTGASIVGAANGTTAAVKGAAPKVERRAPGATAGRAA